MFNNNQEFIKSTTKVNNFFIDIFSCAQKNLLTMFPLSPSQNTSSMFGRIQIAVAPNMKIQTGKWHPPISLFNHIWYLRCIYQVILLKKSLFNFNVDKKDKTSFIWNPKALPQTIETAIKEKKNEIMKCERGYWIKPREMYCKYSGPGITEESLLIIRYNGKY